MKESMVKVYSDRIHRSVGLSEIKANKTFFKILNMI